MTTHPAEAEFLRWIRKNPADDTVRLVYADWLDEHAGDCATCGGHGGWSGGPLCPDCHGRGDRRDRAERAEFIRVQIQLAADDAEDAAHNRLATNPLRSRQWELFAAIDADVFDSSRTIRSLVLNPPAGFESQPTGVISRGFVSHVTLTAAAFLGGECPDCYGVGRHGDFSEAECTSCGGVSGTGKCGTGRTEGLARVLFQNHPIEKVTLSDMRRWAMTDNLEGEVAWGWWEEDLRFPPDAGEGEGGDIPSEIFKIMWDNNPSDDNRHDDGQRRWLLWDDESIPDQELSTALVQYGRGLPGVWD